ncbi:MAG: radical SAM protein [Patescibacteria group bacterium]|nr:radical SAM protein [Patescibacteria group bacterium]
MKIYLIESPPFGVHVFSKITMPRLGLPIIGAYLKEHGHVVIIYVPALSEIDWEDVYTADLVGISSTTSTITAAYAMADQIRAHNIPVIIGGPHVTFMVEEALGHVDYVARFECGEQIMLELIGYLEARGTLEAIDGLSYKVRGKIVNNPPRKKLANLDELPFPDLSLIVGHENMTTTPIMTSWGCPFDCEFCSVTTMFGRKYRFRSPENIIAELKDKKPKNVFFYDDNFAANRSRLKTLLQMIIDEGIKFSWSAQVRTDVTKDPELLDLMAKSGCWQVYLGLESISQETLDSYDKAQSVQDIIDAVNLLNIHGIKSHGMFVLGADTDTKDVVRDTVDFAIEHKISTIMLNILTPLPGTPVYEEIKRTSRIFDSRWEHYDAHHVVFIPKNMTPYELQARIILGYARFFSLSHLIKALFSMNKVKIMLSAWGYTTMKAWRKDKRNKSYVKWLKNLKRGKLR